MAVIGKYKIKKAIIGRIGYNYNGSENSSEITKLKLILDEKIIDDLKIKDELVCNGLNHFKNLINNLGGNIVKVINFDNMVVDLADGQKLDFRNPENITEQINEAKFLYTNKMNFWIYGGGRSGNGIDDNFIALPCDSLSYKKEFIFENAYVEIYDYKVKLNEYSITPRNQAEFLEIYHSLAGKIDKINRVHNEFYSRYYEPLIIRELNMVNLMGINNILKEKGHGQDAVNVLSDLIGNFYTIKSLYHTYFAIRFSHGSKGTDDLYVKILETPRTYFGNYIYAGLANAEKGYEKKAKKFKDWEKESKFEEAFHGIKTAFLAPLRGAMLLMIKNNFGKLGRGLHELKKQKENEYNKYRDLYYRIGGNRTKLDDAVNNYRKLDEQVEETEDGSKIDLSQADSFASEINKSVNETSNSGELHLPNGIGTVVATGISTIYPPSSPYSASIASGYEFGAFLVNAAKIKINNNSNNPNNNNPNNNNPNNNNPNNNNPNNNNSNNSNNNKNKYALLFGSIGIGVVGVVGYFILKNNRNS